ncbi:ABC transporter permease [Nocardioides lijunqiniae]|uniref:ABC transporter permease n=1 Tax=Nocardioides lijunqiniae TaxID=2760832 RepID=UPI00187832E2|nr:FtsX-like permease family protein [Nocardioides lijunqiniae]
MWRASLKSLLGRKVRLLMSTFAIVLGVAFVAGSLIFSDTLSRSFTALFASTVGDVVVRPVGGQTAAGSLSSLTVPASLVDELEGAEGVERVDGNVSAFGVYVVGSDDKVIGGLGPPALGGNYTTAPAAGGEGLELVDGEAPEGRDEIVLDESTAEKGSYEVGDTVELLLPRGTSKLAPTLVGLVGFPDGGSLNGATLTMFDTATAQELFLDGKDEYNDVWVTAEDGVSQEELRDAVTTVLPDEIEAVTGDEAADESASQLLEAISFITVFLLVFAFISLVVGAFLIVNTFSILVAQRSRELALLRALGASKRQVVRSVQLEALVLGLLGSTIGLGLGVLLAMGLRVLFGQFGLDLSGQPLVFGWRTVVASYAVGVLVTMIAAWLPARRTSRISPVQAMRDDVALTETSIWRRFSWGVALAVVGVVAVALGLFADIPYALQTAGGGMFLILLAAAAVSPVVSRPFLSGARSLYTRLFGSIGNLAGQNTLRNPRRTTATASALMISLTLACMMAIVGASAKASVDKSVEENFVGDYVVSNVFGGEFNPAIADEMAEVDGVDTVVRQRYQFGDLGGDGVSAIDPATADRLELSVVEGDLGDFEDGTVVVPESYADDEGLGVGDTVEFETPDGKRTWPVVAVFEDNPIIFVPLVTTLSTLEDAGYEAADNALIIFAEPGAQDLQAGLDAVVEELPIVTVKDQAAFAEEQREPIDQFVLIIFALLGLALIIAVLGVVNTLALSVIERTREVGLLRAIGVSRSQLRWMITLESVVISALGAVLGVILGVGFGIALMYALRDEGLEVIRVPYGQLAAFLVLSVVIGMLAAVLPARRAARLDVLRAIATD